MSIRFRSFVLEDYSELLNIVLELYREDPAGEPITEEKIRKTVNELNRQPGKSKIYIFEEQNMIIGYCILIFYWSNEFGGNILNIDEIFVKEKWRNKGICTRFLNMLYEKFNHSVAAFRLEVTPSNLHAKNYYLKAGFSEDKNFHLIKKVIPEIQP